MRGNELKAERVRQNKSATYMGKLIGKSADAYRRQERGAGKFSGTEIGIIGRDLKLDPEKLAFIFCDYDLLNGKKTAL